MTRPFTKNGSLSLVERSYCSILQSFYVCVLAPSSPEDIKAASLNSDTVLVSWLPPAWPNGEILTYTLYKQADRVSQGSQLPRLTNSALVYEPKYGASANEYSYAHGAQINFGDPTPYLTYEISEGEGVLSTGPTGRSSPTPSSSRPTGSVRGHKSRLTNSALVYEPK